MKKSLRRLSWLLLLTMLFSVFAAGVFAVDEAGTKVALVWEDSAPEGVTEVRLELFVGGEKITKDSATGEDAPIVVKASEDWVAYVDGLSVFDAEGEAIAYTASYVGISGYDISVRATEEGGLVITNKLASAPETETDPDTEVPPETSPEVPPETSPEVPPETSPEVPPETSPEVPPETSPEVPSDPVFKDVTVSVVWDDGENQDGIRPSELKVQLYNGEVAVGDPVALNAAGGWKYTFEDLTTEAAWNVKVVSGPAGYTASYTTDENGILVIKNVHTPETTAYTAQVSWDDNKDQLKQRPDSVQLQLYKIQDTSLVAVGSPVTVKSNSTDKWTYEFTGLPKYAAGKTIVYRFKIVSVPSKYSAAYDYSANTLTLTNGYKDAAKIDFKVAVNWVDNNNKYNKRPGSIQIQLYADGEKSGSVITVKSDSSGNWSYTFKDLSEYKNGAKINYTVKITAVTDYVSKITYTTKDGVTTATITNTYKDIPLTGDDHNLMIWLTLIVAASAVLIGAGTVEAKRIKK